MKLDLSNELDLNKFKTKTTQLIKDGKLVELKEVRLKRSISQNSYIHVLFNLFGLEFGYTLDESKTLLKRSCPFMVYEVNNQKFLKHTRDLETDEMTSLIEWIRDYSGKQGLYLPTPEEYRNQSTAIDNIIETAKRFL